jgi:hypothetical protein
VLAKEPSARREGQYAQVRPSAERAGSCRRRRQPFAEPGFAGRERKAASGMKNVKGRVPVRYWILWWSLIVVADIVFYVLLTPVWMGLRVVAWLAEFRGRRRR